MDVKQQEYFIAIAEEGSLSKAAKRLYISQPSLSQFLSKLEFSLNKRLFTRKSNGTLVLTDAGTLYLECAYEVVATRDRFFKKLSDLDQQSAINLNFGINAGRGMQVLSQILSSLSSQYPHVHVETKQAAADQLALQVANNDLDMAYSAFDEHHPKLEYVEFLPCEIVMAVSASHPISIYGTQTPFENLPHLPLRLFKDEDFALLKNGTVLRRVVDKYIETQKLTLNAAIETHDITAAFAVVENNPYIALCPYNLMPNSQYAKISYIGLDPPLFYRTGLYYNKSIYQSKFVQDFLKVAKKLSIISPHESRETPNAF